MRSILKRIKNIIYDIYTIRGVSYKILHNMASGYYDVQHRALMEKAMNCNEPGISDDKLCPEEVVVSLTSYGKRIYDVAVTIESIMQGTVKPNKIVLWLDKKHRGKKLPKLLQKQMARGLEVEYCKDLRAYTKLIPALHKYPDSAVITIDDDQIYNLDLVERLVDTHCDNPGYIIANRIHNVVLGKDNKPIPYNEWKWEKADKKVSPLNFFTGVGGVLYPPSAFDDEIFNETVFTDICKYADDVWYFCMALKKGTPVMKNDTRSARGVEYLTNEEVQDMALYHTNLGTDENSNDAQLSRVMDRYDLWDRLLQ